MFTYDLTLLHKLTKNDNNYNLYNFKILLRLEKYKFYEICKQIK